MSTSPSLVPSSTPVVAPTDDNGTFVASPDFLSLKESIWISSVYAFLYLIFVIIISIYGSKRASENVKNSRTANINCNLACKKFRRFVTRSYAVN